MSSNFIKNLLEYMELSEDLGPLADLKAGNLINVFKQSSHGGVDDKKFTRQWGGNVGRGSEITDIGEISGWKDLRKHLKPGDGKYAGFILYIDGQAFASCALFDSTLSKPKSDRIIIAFDAAALPAEPVSAKDQKVSRWDYQQNKNVDTIQNPIKDRTTRKEITTTDYSAKDENGRSIRKEIATGKFRTGVSSTPEQLYKYVDEVAEMVKPTGSTITAKLISKDYKGAETQRTRSASKQDTDELEIRQQELKGERGGYGDRKRSLNVALDKYKAGKNMNNFSEDDEMIEFLRDSNNFGQTFVYKGKQYKFAIDDYSKTIKVDAAKLISGEPVEFRVSFPATDRSSYNSLYVTYQVGSGGTDVVKIGY